MESEETKNMGRFFHPIENDGEKPWRRDEAVRMCGSGYGSVGVREPRTRQLGRS